MQVRVIITATGSAIGPLFDIYAVNGGSISTLIASDVVPSTLFGAGIVYNVPNDTIQIKIVNIELDGSAGACDDYIMDILLAPTTTSTTTTHVVSSSTTTTTTIEVVPTTSTTTSTSSTSTSTTSTSTSSSTTTTSTTSETPPTTTTTTTLDDVDKAYCHTLYIDKNYIPVEPDPNTQLWAFVLIPGEAQTWVKLLITSGQEGDYENACVCSTIGFTLGWSTISDPPTEGQDPESLFITSENTYVECDDQLECGTCWEIEPPTTSTSTTGEPTTTSTTTNEVMLSCSDFGVSFENNLPGNDNQWSAWINLPVAATGDTDFEIGFAATRNDTTGSCNTTVNVTVLSGQTTGSATSMTCIENIQAESWTVDSWEIVSITPDTGKYNKIYCGVR